MSSNASPTEKDSIVGAFKEDDPMSNKSLSDTNSSTTRITIGIHCVYASPPSSRSELDVASSLPNRSPSSSASSSSTILLSLPDTVTMQHVKQQCSQRADLSFPPVASQKMIYGGKVCHDAQLLTDVLTRANKDDVQKIHLIVKASSSSLSPPRPSFQVPSLSPRQAALSPLPASIATSASASASSPPEAPPVASSPRSSASVPTLTQRAMTLHMRAKQQKNQQRMMAQQQRMASLTARLDAQHPEDPSLSQVATSLNQSTPALPLTPPTMPSQTLQMQQMMLTMMQMQQQLQTMTQAQAQTARHASAPVTGAVDAPVVPQPPLGQGVVAGAAGQRVRVVHIRLNLNALRHALHVIDLGLALKCVMAVLLLGHSASPEKFEMLVLLAMVAYLVLSGMLSSLVATFRGYLPMRRPAPEAAGAVAGANAGEAHAPGAAPPGRPPRSWMSWPISTSGGFFKDLGVCFLAFGLSLVPSWQPVAAVEDTIPPLPARPVY